MERLTVGEAAERLEISEQAVRKRVQRGTLPHAKQDGHVYVYLDSERSLESPTEGGESDNQTTLNYLDKVYISWQAHWGSRRRFLLLILADSILLLALSGGAISTEETVTVFGVGLRVPLVIFMVTGALLLPIFINGMLISNWLGRLYENEMVSLYKSLGLANSATNSPADPFWADNFQAALSFGYRIQRKTGASEDVTPPTPKPTIEMRSGSWLIYIPLLNILPAAAQAGAGYKISALLKTSNKGWFSEMFASVGEAFAWIFAHLYLPRQGSDWIWAYFVVLALATALVLFLHLMSPGNGEVEREAESEEEPEAESEANDLHPIKRYIRELRKARRAAAEGKQLEVILKRPTPIRKFTTYLIAACMFCGPFTWIGVWIGYLVAAS